jgi:hypothetical protein
MKVMKCNPAGRRESNGFIARIARLRIAFSLGEGLEFLPFIRKGKKYPVNPVSSKLTCIYVQSFMPFSITVDIAYLPLSHNLLAKTV